MATYVLDGNQYVFPDDVSQDEALKFISEKTNGQTQAPQALPSDQSSGYFGNIKNSVNQYIGNVGSQLARPERYPLQHAAQTANGVLGLPGAAIGAALSPLKPVAKGIFEGAAYAGGAPLNSNATGITQSIGTIEQPIANAAQKYPAVQAALDLGQLGANVVGYGWGKIGASAAEDIARQIPGEIANVSKAINPTLDNIIQKGIDKGIKPTNIPNNDLPEFSRKANIAIKTIAENKDALNLEDADGNTINRPKSNADLANAITQTKQNIYQKYTKLAKMAGDNSASQFDARPIIDQLGKVAQAPGEELSVNDPRLKYSQSARQYAYKMQDEIQELHGASPEIIQSRIQDLNNSLAGYYDGRVAKSVASIDASIAQSMRTQLDSKIENAVGPGYQDLKNQYGSLKSIEDAVNHRALVQARSASKNVFDLTDVFTGAKLVGGIATMNPALVAEAGAGRVIKEIYKSLNNPDRYIDKMFEAAYSDADKTAAGKIAAEQTMPKTISQSVPSPQIPDNTNIPAFWRNGVNPATYPQGQFDAVDRANRIGANTSTISDNLRGISRLRPITIGNITQK